jgi:outer membrane protein assembly factor BamB
MWQRFLAPNKKENHMKPGKAPVHFRWPAAPAFVIALLAAGHLVLGARMSEAQVLWGSSSKGAANPSSIFTVDRTTGLATLVGASGLGDGVSAIRFDPQSGTMYGILGSSCTGARLITIDPATGAGTLIGVLVGAGFNGGLPNFCAGGSDALAFAPDGTLYAGGYVFGATSLLKVEKSTGAVLEAHPTADSLVGLAFDPAGTLWASHGNSSFTFELHTIDPATGARTSTLPLSEPVIVSDLAFAADGTLFASLPSENNLATVDTTTGLVTRIGSFGPAAGRISGLAMDSPISQLTALAPASRWVG